MLFLPDDHDYDAIRRGFRWDIPERLNIADLCCLRHVAAGKGGLPALLRPAGNGAEVAATFSDIDRLSAKLANAFAAFGLERGDRVAILLPQALETAVGHIACYRAGLIAVPLFTLFGLDALRYRLRDSGARLVITDGANVERLLPLSGELPDLDVLLAVDTEKDAAGAGGGPAIRGFWPVVEQASDSHRPIDSRADDPALMIYTSGTTGSPKGALHAHRVLLGHLPGVSLPHDLFPQPGDRFWTPADWAWIGGLLDVLLPAWFHAVPVLMHRARKFDPEEAFALIAGAGVRNMFLPPTALKLMRQAGPAVSRPGVRSIGSGGETLGAELLDWGRSVFGLTINEFYGQTECNLIVGNCAAIMPVKPGAMGRPIPGHELAVIDEDGQPAARGESGQVAIRRGDPVMFLRYWNKPADTEGKFIGDWLVTGDLAREDEDGYLWFVGRADDVITSAGYRIGPAEIEEAALTDPDVVMAAAIGVPDPVRTEVVWLYVQPREGLPTDGPAAEALAGRLRDLVRDKVGAHLAPRRVLVVDGLPLTTTGKIMRRVLRDQAGRELGA